MKEILHLPLGHTPEQRAWADRELNDLYTEHGVGVNIVGVYVNAMSFDAMPTLVVIIPKESE